MTYDTQQIQVVRVHREELWRIAELRFIAKIVDAAPWYHNIDQPPPNIAPFFRLPHSTDDMFMGIDLKVESPVAFQTPLGGILTIEALSEFVQRAHSLAFQHKQPAEIK